MRFLRMSSLGILFTGERDSTGVAGIGGATTPLVTCVELVLQTGELLCCSQLQQPRLFQLSFQFCGLFCLLVLLCIFCSRELLEVRFPKGSQIEKTKSRLTSSIET